MIFHQYIWIINKLKACGGLTFEQLNRKWMDDRVADGNPLAIATFHRHRKDIVDMFGIVIECHKPSYKYFISNHPYMRLHVDKGKENGASLREQILKEFLKNFLL